MKLYLASSLSGLTAWQVADLTEIKGLSLDRLGIEEVFVPHRSGLLVRLGNNLIFRDGRTLLLSWAEMNGMDAFLDALEVQIARARASGRAGATGPGWR